MRVLLATDGKPASLGAIRFAVLLDEAVGASVRAVRVSRPIPTYAPANSPTQLPPSPTLIEDMNRGALEEAAMLLTSAGPRASSWPLTVEVGPVPVTITHAAEDQGASMIVIGAGSHDRMDRWFGSETALRVMHHARMPVLAVPADGGRARPGNIVAAVDFSDFSRDALLAAVSIASPGARIHLAFVISTEQDLVKVKGIDAGAAAVERVQADLAEWAKAAGVPNEFRLEFHSLEGKPAQEILRIAGRIDADLIAAGSHGAGFFGRTVLGSVSTAILRGAGCAVLVAPPRHR